MHPSFGAVEFLAGSSNRFDVLAAVSVEPRTRADLKELTGLSRVALSRGLSGLEDRNWIVRVGDHYEATSIGAVVADEFETLLDNIDVAAELEGTLEWLPTGEFGFDLRHLRDATVTSPTAQDHTRSVRYAVERIREADRFRAIARGIAYEVIEAQHERTVENGLPTELVIGADAIDYLRSDGELGPLFREFLESDVTDVFRYDGEESPVMMTVTDEFVSIRGYEDPAVVQHVETTSRAVRSWAESYFETVRDASERLTADAFVDGSNVE